MVKEVLHWRSVGSLEICTMESGSNPIPILLLSFRFRLTGLKTRARLRVDGTCGHLLFCQILVPL